MKNSKNITIPENTYNQLKDLQTTLSEYYGRNIHYYQILDSVLDALEKDDELLGVLDNYLR